MIKEAVDILLKGQDLAPSQMQAVIEEIMSGSAVTADIVLFLRQLSEKGETAEEVAAAVSVMRRHAVKITSKHNVILDTCGTGGDRKGTFNVSTAVAFVAAGAGVAVAKHGNRSISSCCGSADILEELGININQDKATIERCLDEAGIAFMFAPNMHPAMKYAMPARKEIGRRTIFNILGPLSNPASATHQLIGVFEKRWLSIIAEALCRLGSAHALVVHGEDGLDEITTTAKTFIAEARQAKVDSFEIDPEGFGIKKAEPEDLAGRDAVTNAGILLEVLKGKKSPYRDIVLLNSAAALYAADKAASIDRGMKLAQESIDSGRALEKLELLRKYSK